MKHYLHHLFYDPLGLLDQIVRDTLIAFSIITAIALIFFIYLVYNIIFDRNKNLYEADRDVERFR